MPKKHLKAVKDLTQLPEASLALADFYIERRDVASARELLEPLAKAPATATQAKGRSLGAARWDTDRHAVHVQALVAKSMMLLGDGRVEEALAPAQLAVQFSRSKSTTQSHPSSRYVVASAMAV